MRILVVGAGAVGGYFGGRQAESRKDVTFLVRQRRAAQLATSGLVIKSPAGDYLLPRPRTLLAEQLNEHFDVILLSCKAYSLDSAVDSFAPAVASHTLVLPLLNGMRHLSVLDERFGKEKILGGQCVISATLGDNGDILHLVEQHSMTFGARDSLNSLRAAAIAREFGEARFQLVCSANILQDMWEKWVRIASLAGSTCLMRAAIGDIISSPGGFEFMQQLLDECCGIAAACGYSPCPAFLETSAKIFAAENSTLSASMLKDIEHHSLIESAQIIGDLIERAPDQSKIPFLRLVYTHLRSYENRRARTLKTLPVACSN